MRRHYTRSTPWRHTKLFADWPPPDWVCDEKTFLLCDGAASAERRTESDAPHFIYKEIFARRDRDGGYYGWFPIIPTLIFQQCLELCTASSCINFAISLSPYISISRYISPSFSQDYICFCSLLPIISSLSSLHSRHLSSICKGNNAQHTPSAATLQERKAKTWSLSTTSVMIKPVDKHI